jgi:anti-sigma factor RsiW
MSGPALGETMSCKEFVELVTDYLEGRMPPAEAERFDAHIELCPPCLRYLDQMRSTLEALGRIPEDSISAAARTELLHAFGDWHSGRPRG